MQFLTFEQLQLNAAGYLISSVDNKPVTHAAFVAQQAQADYVVRLAAAIKGKNFKEGKVDDLEAIKREVRAAMSNTNMTYGTAPTKPVGEITSKLADEALAFDKFHDSKAQFEQINRVMQNFNAIRSVGEVGDYFSEGVVKTPLHSIETILAAVTATVELLGDL